VKQNYCYGLSWLKMPFISIFLILLPSLEAKAQEKSDLISQSNQQLVVTTKDINSHQIVSTSAVDLLAQPRQSLDGKNLQNRAVSQNNLTRVTGIELNETNKGLEVILKTAAGGQRLVPLILPEGNKLVIDILDANLAFGIRNGVTKANPAPGIKAIALTKVDASSLRLTITGETQAPRAEVVPSRQNLVLSINPQRTTAQTKPEQEIEIIATGAGTTDNYYVPDASSGTRTDTPIRDIPQSIQVIPQEILEDQQVNRLDEALSNVSGTTFGGALGNTGLNFNIRGFDETPVLLDGFRQFGSVSLGSPEIANLDRVEVLKGPASILYGEVQPGGVINLVSKQPLKTPSYEAELSLGNREFVEPNIDFSAPLTEDGKLAYRLNALYRHNDGFIDFAQDFDRWFIAPVVSWQIGKNTDLTVQLEYTDEIAPLENGLVASGDGIVEDVPFERNISELDDFTDKQRLNLGYNLEHRWSKNWKLRNAFRYNNRNIKDLSVLPFEFEENTGTLTRFSGLRQTNIKSYSLQTNVVGEFTTGAIAHTLLMGVDLNRTDEVEDTKIGSNPLLLNIFDPVYEAITEADFDEIPATFDLDTQTDRLGVYLQDQVAIADQLKLLAGLRYDTVEKNVVDNASNSETTQNDDAVIPRIGIVYQPIPALSLYGSYSQSFTPSAETTSNGDPLTAERGKGFEVGVKSELFAKKVLATLAYFNITKQNVANPDPIDPLSSIATGEEQSQGIEFDLSGEILPGWKLITSYAYIDAEVAEDSVIPVGNRLYNTPEHSASLWTTYEIQQGNLQGLGFGGGFNFVGERQGDLDNSFTVDSYFLANAAIFYQQDDWRLALNFKNLFDLDYISATNNSRTNGNEPGAPLTVIGSVAVKF
jgi:iron complex outermembrane recepter protein